MKISEVLKFKFNKICNFISITFYLIDMYLLICECTILLHKKKNKYTLH